MVESREGAKGRKGENEKREVREDDGEIERCGNGKVESSR
jgi:hypothetical protein